MNDFFMFVAFGGLAIAIVAGWLPLHIGRIVYWSGAVITTVSVFFMAYPHDWGSGLMMSLFAACAITGVAYVHTEFISIRGKTFSLFADPNTIDDYGLGLTPTKTWWLTVLGVAILVTSGVSYVADGAAAWLPVGMGAIAVFIAVSLGYRDALARRVIAAGQKIQLGLLTVLTLGAFPILYLIAYKAGTRRTADRRITG
ncbi:hypothetical protein AU184_25395 [Mycolicibacterium novocastrense]|uniref:hypothetical protein n=2 Tax=Mycobacteriaceae TaxID=1762 RepID=UPI00074A3893|nr:hypothetical protein [Mycolicibacterium novocastrense]KUH74121.1 hypothetical protein AU184_25395 [Mycolicibacterium novocastrense]KUH75383.1 hypothetical protein AU183_07475 [Mycolicibacterium novocastrense]KUH76384.1 hypothetical protein AU072_23430 [Mycolicibacterium novocastrense]KUI46455.1 hypothetical protein AU198_02290 [Mycobacterium sp. GA-1199]